MPRKINLKSLRLDHGGGLRVGKRKIARPFDHSRCMVVVFSSSRAKGVWSLLRPNNKTRVEKTIESCARRYQIKIYRFDNMGSQLHLLIKTKSKDYWQAKCEFQSFIRQVPGEIAFQIMKAKKTKAMGRFWDHLTYSRIVSWEHEFDSLQKNHSLYEGGEGSPEVHGFDS